MHTPGDWYIWNEEKELDINTCCDVPVICAPGDDGSVDIALVYNDLDEFASNARILVSAPKLYKYLAQTLKVIETIDFSHFPGNYDEIPWDEIDKVIAYIEQK